MISFSAHKITNKYNLGFSPEEYSKFKFGDKTIAKKFGYELADKFIYKVFEKDFIHQMFSIPLVVASSPYCFIPTATFAMKDYFIQRLNSYLIENGLDVVQETKIHRTITYKEDYGGLSAEQRLSLIKNDEFHIDKEFVEGKTILFLDDIKITGSHELVVKRMIENYNLSANHMFLYFAELSNAEINPNIENYLNYYFVKSLLHLDKIIKNENFMLNTRVVKYILCADFQEFKNFIQYQSNRMVNTIYHLAIGNSYHKIEEYKANLNYIKELVNNNH